ncbi:Usp family protein [Taphrina deformans PYCC 5710]|uniref:Usp family protein n=1 Tax=Taphrina deformans (strain PYCC 5710 / ATCC 11124 / CBS 356.35 / IMI 108563 / JCM 9778 / NBRC 8474) TaxID=1097556 RepID=R4XAD9_TAPDE|nr:Usp family protein [Taphrina deformans PYCC 5710]|eukprot:CCG82472.1 Usp family protein [Taphrina deformans PYCC 5710]
MVFDASKPIVRKGRPQQQASLESAMAEEAREVEALIAARDARNSMPAQEPRPRNLESEFNFRVNDRGSSSNSNPMFASRKPVAPQHHSSPAGEPGGPMLLRDSRSRPSGGLGIPASDPRRASSPGPQPNKRTGSRSSGSEMDFTGAHRKLSQAILASSQGTLASLPMSATQREAIEKDRLTKDHDPEAAIESDSSDSGDESTEDEALTDPGEHRNRRAPMSLAQAAENERVDVERSDTRDRLRKENDKTQSLHMIINDNSPSAVKRKPIHPNTSYTDDGTGDQVRPEDEDDDPFEEIARDMTLVRSVSSEEAGRLICSVQRADFHRIRDAVKRTRHYLVSVDLSPQAKYALEWTIGTVMRDGDICRVVHALEYNEKEDRSTAQQQREERAASLEDICVDVNLFLKRTRLSVKIEIEVMHHSNPKHLITEIIDTTKPTMVIIGSRGRSNISGIMLGSFSNYIVNKSSAPVMVARKRLRRGSKKRRIVPGPPRALQFPNNLGTFSSVKLID